MAIREFTFRDIFFICDLGEREFAKYNGPCAMSCLMCMAEPNALTLIYAHDEFEDERFGFAIVQWKEDQSYIGAVVTIPGARRRGVASALIAECVNRMRGTYGSHIMALEVAQSNVISRAFFKKLGFREQAVHRQYKSGENAIRMVRNLE